MSKCKRSRERDYDDNGNVVENYKKIIQLQNL